MLLLSKVPLEDGALATVGLLFDSIFEGIRDDCVLRSSACLGRDAAVSEVRLIIVHFLQL